MPPVTNKPARQARLTFSGLAPGECPSVTITIPVGDENEPLIRKLLKDLDLADPRGPTPIAPLTTRGRR